MVEYDMSFVTTDTGTWDDPWVLGLSLEEHQVWHYLIYAPDFFDSVAEFNPVLWPTRTKLTMEQILPILDKFKAAGKIEIHGDVVWVVKGLRYRKWKGTALSAALGRINDKYVDRLPKLVKKVMAMYGHKPVTQQQPADPGEVNEDITKAVTLLQSLRGWEIQPNDTAWTIDLSEEYSAVSMYLVARKLQAWMEGNAKAEAGKLRFRNFVANAKKFGNDLKPVVSGEQVREVN